MARAKEESCGPGGAAIPKAGSVELNNGLSHVDKEQNFSTCLSSFKPHNSLLRRTRMGAGTSSVVGSSGGGELQSWDQGLGPARGAPWVE